MLNYLLLLLSPSINGVWSQVMPTVKVTVPASPVLTDGNGKPIGISTLISNPSSGISIKAPAYFDPDKGKGNMMCPVVNINMMPSGNGMQIKPQYQTFNREEPVFIEVYALDGVRFTEFFIQGKDVKSNKTVGHWTVTEANQEAYG